MREQVTTWLELAGLLVLNAAATLYVSGYSLPGALAVCGVLLLATSALIVKTSPKPGKPEQEIA